MKDRNKVVKMVIIITIVCVLVILGAAIGLKYTSLGEKIESKISGSNTEDTIIPGEGIPIVWLRFIIEQPDAIDSNVNKGRKHFFIGFIANVDAVNLSYFL